MQDLSNTQSVAQAVIDAIGTSLLVLDQNLTVVSTNRAYCKAFNLGRHAVEGRRFYDLGSGEWNIPDLLKRLHAVVPEHHSLEAYEVEKRFSGCGRRIMRLDAWEMASTVGAQVPLLVAITDITAAREVERGLAAAVMQKEVLLEEMSHRIANSLMIMASVLLLGVRKTEHPEARRSLEDAHSRVMSIAAVQKQLRTLAETEVVEMGSYLSNLCEHLATAMIKDRPRIQLKVEVHPTEVDSIHAVHIGLIVTELVINALKHAFPYDNENGQVVVAYETASGGWILKVSDDGVGGFAEYKSGLGTLIIQALASQLNAEVEVSPGPVCGRCVAVTHKAALPMGSNALEFRS